MRGASILPGRALNVLSIRTRCIIIYTALGHFSRSRVVLARTSCRSLSQASNSSRECVN